MAIRRIIFPMTSPKCTFELQTNGAWVVREHGQSPLQIPSRHRLGRYVQAGVSGVKHTLLDRYFPWGTSILHRATVIDVGANIGEFSLAVVERGASSVRCFEPDQYAHEALVVNLQYLPNADIHHALLDSRAGEREFYYATETADSSIFLPNCFSRQVKVESIPLDSMKEQLTAVAGPIVLKVEAEGAEPEVLEGSRQFLSSRSDIYVTIRASNERLGESTMAACRSIMESLGYLCAVGPDGKQLVAVRSKNMQSFPKA